MEKKILIIDDDADIRFTVREICKLRKWRTLEAACYEEAAPLLEQERPDLILIDYHMPGLDGVRAIQEIRRTNYSIPIIVLTIEEREALSLIHIFPVPCVSSATAPAPPTPSTSGRTRMSTSTTWVRSCPAASAATSTAAIPARRTAR